MINPGASKSPIVRSAAQRVRAERGRRPLEPPSFRDRARERKRTPASAVVSLRDLRGKESGLLKLREIELLGFKSFADRTRLVCDGNAAAIVGPNGCGKSNLADAVSWVLGEQSARMLRGERMSDVIFSGTGARLPIGMAEVNVALLDEDREIKVTRRLFRSGESEYMLNGEPCRLRDIQDVFMGTGLGPESYAIIEQGRIGQILSSKPSDRRALIEEAAGISKFKSRKRLAEAKLESSRQNLARIHDILEEISKQAASLKRQASKAARCRELQEELHSRQRRVFSSRLLVLEEQYGRLREALASAQEESAAAAQEVEELDRQCVAAARCHENSQEELRRLREQMAASEIEAERLHSRLEKARQQNETLKARGGEAEEEKTQLEREMALLMSEAQQRAETARKLQEEVRLAGERAAQCTERHNGLARELAAREREAESLRREAIAAVASAADARSQLVKAEEMGASVERQLARIEGERSSAQQEFERHSSEFEAVGNARQACEQEVASLLQLMDTAQAALEQARSKEVSVRAEAETLSRELSEVSAREQALRESIARHAYASEGVRRLLAVPASNFQRIGVLADFVEVASGYEEIVEEFLKPELDCVVVERHDDARSGIALLRSTGDGRSTFFVRGFSSNGRGGGLPAHEVAEAREANGVVASFKELVHFEPKLGLNGDVAFPVLEHSFLVEDAAAAERLAVAYPACHFVTAAGEHYHHRLVSGGKGASAGPLALRRDFRELERRALELRASLTQAEECWSEARARLAAAEEEVRRLAGEQVNAEKQLVLANEKTRQAAEAVRHAADRAGVLNRETETLAAEAEELRQRKDQLQIELEATRARGEQCERDAAVAVVASRELRATLDELGHVLTAERVKAGALEERLRAAEAASSRVAAEQEGIGGKLVRLEAQVAAWAEERLRLEQETEGVERLLARASARQEELDELIRTREAESQAARAERDGLQPCLEAARSTLDARREKKAEAEVALARAESDLGHHVHQCREELGAEPEELRAGFAAEERLEGELLAAAEEELRGIKTRIERLGPVNMMALEELQEAEERLNFLESQRQDLLASINDTAQTIREIDEASRRQFTEAFRAINGFFAETFRSLFGGGQGEMRLSDEADPESGLDIVAQPPGKRLQNILLLSGGEKALTALALLLAIFRFTPSPFCILDEVDAPLDESNVVRFTQMIEEMSAHTQFILITHNKRTMEVCRTLYGVTMEEPGVSKLVSVRFEAADRKLAAVPA